MKNEDLHTGAGTFLVVSQNGKTIDVVDDPNAAGFFTGSTTGYRYTDNDGNVKYTTKEYDLPTSFSWDSNTGRIKITAPKSVQESDWFKKQFTDNDNFKAIAMSFENDPTGQTSLTTYDEDGKETKKTIQELLEDYQKSFNEYASQYRDISILKEEAKEKSGLDLSDSDAAIYGYGTNREKDKFDSNKVVFIPDIAMNYFDFSKIGSWNAENHTISAKDFYEWYNLDDGTEGKDKLITDLTNATGQMYSQYNKYQRNLTDEGRDDDVVANDYARTVSFLRTLQADNPEANVLTSTRLFVTSAANSFVDNLFQATGNILEFTSDLIDGLDAADEQIVPLKLVTEPLKFGRGMFRTGELMFYNLGATVSGVDIDAANKQLGEIALVGDIADSVADGNTDGVVEVISKNLGLSRALAANDLKLVGHDWLLEAHNDMTRLSSAATAGTILGGAVGEVLKQVTVTNPIGAAAGATVESVVSGMKFLTKGMSASALCGAVKLGSVSTNLVAQGISDTILNDEEALKRMFLQGDPTDAVEAVTMNTVFNGFGELTGLATTKGWDAFTRTSVGQTVQVFEQRVVANVQYRKQRALASLAEKLNNMKKNPDEAAEYYTSWAKAEANASERIAKARKYAEPGETVTQATQRMVQDKVDLEVAFTRINTQGSRSVLEIQANPEISKYFVKTQSAAGKVIQLENASGVKNQGKVLFSQETSDYIGLSKRAQELAHKEKLTQGEEEFLSAISKRISEFKNSHSPEMLDAINDYVHALEQYTYTFNSFRAANGLIDAEELESMRASGLWGENGMEYVHLQTIKNTDQLASAKDYVKLMSEGKNYKAKLGLEQHSYKVGDADAHYMDPQLAVLSEQIATAKVMDARDWGDAILKTQPFAQEIDLNGKPISNKELSKLRDAVNYSANNVFKKFSAEDTIFDYDFAKTFADQDQLGVKILKKVTKKEKLLDISQKRLTQTALNLDTIDIMTLRLDLDLPEYLPVRTQKQLDALYDSASNAQKTVIDQAMGIGGRTVSAYNNAIRNTDLGDKLVRMYISENNDILNSKTFKSYATELREQQLTARQQTILKETNKKIAELRKEAKLVELGEDEYTATILRFTDHVVLQISEDLEENVMFNEAIQKFVDAGVDKGVATRYLALDKLKKELASSRGEFNTMLYKNLERINVSGNLSTATKNRYAKAIRQSIKDNVDSEWANSVKTLQDNGAAGLIDTESLFKDIRSLMKDIIDTKIKSPNVIQVLTKDGDFKLYEVSPVTASLYNTRPNLSNIKNKGIVRFFNQTNRIFRIMTTGWGLNSFENQWMRDPLGAYVMGGLTRGLESNTEELGRILGPNLTNDMKKQLDEAGWGGLAKELPEGVTEGEAVAQNVRQTAEMFYGGASEETKYYRQMATARRETLFGDYEKPVGNMEKALEWMESHSLGNFRETYIRKDVYVSAFNKATSLGKTAKEAKNFAEYVADNATTDFSRAFAWGNQLTSSVPYLGAAINGHKSFWRLLELDPLGVSGRFFSGLVLPTISLTAQSLSNEENRKVYENIPEYMKEDNICFVVDGTAFKIPIPQELSAFVAPFRQLVEKSYKANNNTWGELLLSDILNVPPVDLGGLADLDDPLGKDADFWSRLSNEAETLISQLSPVAVKTAYMAATGRDPYTHNAINRQYTYVDSDGNLQIMDSEDNAIAKFVSSACKAFGIDLSPSSAEALLSSFFGQAGVDFAGSLGNIFSGDMVGALSVYGKQISKPFTATSYNKLDSAWKEVVKELQAEKQTLMENNSDLSKLSQQLVYATDPEKIQKLRAQIRQITQTYQDHVFNTVQKFNSVYGADYDYKKFASTINLLNFTNLASPAIDDATLSDAKELASDNRNSALATMSEMGFNSTNDLSIFGYLKTDADGDVSWKATLPTAIVYSENSNFYRGVDQTVARLETAIARTKLSDGKTLKEKSKEVSNLASSYYDKKDYDSVNKLYKEWDIAFMNAIYPILAENDLMDQYGNSILKNKSVVDLLDDYIKVPSDAMGRGKYISSSTGIDKNRGYAKSYIQKIYKQLRGEN